MTREGRGTTSRPAGGHVDVWLWRSTAAAPQRTEVGLALLSDAERQRWRRFVSIEAADTYLVARRLLRTTLSRYVDVAPRDWVFETNAYGKPFVASPDGAALGFNLAHTRGLVACAIHATQAVGIDVERIDPTVDIDGVASVALVAGEKMRLDAAPASRRPADLLRYWTLKEAYLKATGFGLSRPLQSFGFDLDAAPPRIVFETPCDDAADRWHFREFAPRPDVRMAVAVRLAEGDAMSTTLRWVAPDAV